jgi:hypothetical protein
MAFPTDPVQPTDTYGDHVARTNEHFADASQHSTAVNVAAFGATSGASATQTRQAFEDAIAYAVAENRRSIYVPSRGSDYFFDAPISSHTISIIGERAGDCKLTFSSGTVPSGGYAITITSEAGITWHPTIENLTIRGPDDALGLGVRGNFHGVRLGGTEWLSSCNYFLNNLELQGFDFNIVCDNDIGHIFLTNVRSNGGYYAVYFVRANADYSFINCDFTTNRFAGIGLPKNTGLNMASFWKCHFGFSPYGIFQSNDVDTNPGGRQTGFLYQCDFIGCDFEAVGNGAIVSEAVKDGTYPTTGDMLGTYIRGGWHDFNAIYNIAGRNKDYWINVPKGEWNTIDWGARVFPYGDLGLLKYGGVGGWQIFGADNGAPGGKTLAQGDTSYNQIDKRVLGSHSVTIASGQTSQAFTYDGWVKAAGNAARPVLSPRSDPGGRFWISARSSTGFTVTREGNTASAVTFDIQLFS